MTSFHKDKNVNLTSTSPASIQALPSIPSVEDVIPITKRVLAEIQAVRDKVAETVDPSTACFENAIKPLIDVENRTQCELGVVAMLRYASPDKHARDASVAAAGLMRESSAKFNAREDLFCIFKAVKDRAESLDHESAKYLNDLFKDFTRCGHGVLDEDQIKLYLKTRTTIDNLRSEYNKNIRDEDGGIWLSLDELDGVPEDRLARFGERVQTEEGEKVFVHHWNVEEGIVMEWARKPATRKKMNMSVVKKLPQNADLFKRIVVLRAANARLLDYSSHAAFRVDKKVAKTTEFVEDLLYGLEEALFPAGQRERKESIEVKRKWLLANTDIEDEHKDTLAPWDISFYSRISREGLHLVESTEVAEYFPLRFTVSAMLEIFSSCLQLRFDTVRPELMVDANAKWHEDVEVWSVWDERNSKGNGSEFVGYLYTDLLWRPGKHQGNQNCNLQASYVKNDGTRVYAATILMCNFASSVATPCPLLRHGNLVSLFHELGHGIHDLLSRASYVHSHPHGSPADFAEAPSMMLENWCWLKDELRKMSCHYTTLDPAYLSKWQEEHPNQPSPPEKIPDRMVESLLRGRDLGLACHYLRQVFHSRFDWAVHSVSSLEEIEDLDLTKVWNDLKDRITIIDNPDPSSRGHGYADFGHLCAGYDAGYYSYLCAEVIAADLYHNNFAKNPRDQVAWEKYRRGILEPGGSRDELEMLVEFLGHRPDPRYLLKGVKSAA